MNTRQEIEDRIKLFMSNIRKGLSYDANVVLLVNDIEEAISQGQTLPIDSVVQQSELLSCETCKFNCDDWDDNHPCANCAVFEFWEAT